MDDSWNGQHVLVTGGASGIARATVLKLAQRGANVIALDRNRDALIELARSEVEGSITPLQCDLADPASIASAFAQVKVLDAAVNAAAISHPYLMLEQIDLKMIDDNLAVNLRAVALCMQHELKLIRKQGSGAIVNISSGGGLKGAKGQSVYSAVKHAVIGLTRSVAAEVAAEGIRINVVCPGTTETPMLERFRQAAGTTSVADAIVTGRPMGRAAQPEEIADGIIWALGSTASYVVGAAISIDGGVTAV